MTNPTPEALAFAADELRSMAQKLHRGASWSINADMRKIITDCGTVLYERAAALDAQAKGAADDK